MGLAGCGAAWLKPQSVDGSAACYRIGAVIHSPPWGVAPARELGSASCLIGAVGYDGSKLVPCRSMACMMMASRRASATRAFRMVDRLPMASAQSFSFSAPL